jgi:hypothetical protein
MHRRVEAEVFGNPVHVHTADDESAPRSGLDDTKELQRLGCLAQTRSADTESRRQFRLCRQAVSGFEIAVQYECLQAFGNDVAKLGPFDDFGHEFFLLKLSGTIDNR